jgi:hypothetical protein
VPSLSSIQQAQQDLDRLRQKRVRVVELAPTDVAKRLAVAPLHHHGGFQFVCPHLALLIESRLSFCPFLLIFCRLSGDWVEGRSANEHIAASILGFPRRWRRCSLVEHPRFQVSYWYLADVDSDANVPWFLDTVSTDDT